MATLSPNEQERSAAKVPHDLFLSNLIVNHILLFTGIAAFGASYIKLMILVPVISFLVIAFTFYRSSHIKRENSDFVWLHWQIARRWSKIFLAVLLLLTTVSVVGILANIHLGLMKEAVYAMIGGLGILPTLVSTLILIVIESDSLHHARVGTAPKWALSRFLGIEPEDD